MTAPDPIATLRIPTWSREAEESVLGGLLIDPARIDEVGALLTEADFYATNNRYIFRAIAALSAVRQVPDAITVAAWLKDRGLLEDNGPSDDGKLNFKLLQALADGVPSAKNVLLYAEIVREKSIRRAVAAAAQRMESIATDSDGRSARQILDEALGLLADVDERTQRGRGTFQRMGDVFQKVLAEVDAAKAGTAGGWKTGFIQLDHIMNPMLPGQLVVVGARPGVGKTSLAVNIGCHVAKEYGAEVAMFSMEMTDPEIAIRILAGYSGIASGKFREHRIGDKEWERINMTLTQYGDMPFHIDASGGLSIQEITARARMARKQIGRLDVIIVDYIQLSRAEGRYDNRAVELGAVTSGLKRLAKELECTVIALSQLNRDAAKENKRPTISELRDSGSIEADADTILLLHRPFVMNQKGEQEFDAEIIVGKQRNGQIGHVDLDYDARFTRFYDLNQAPGRGRAP